ncbi:MAG: hypothetical protein HC866_03970 [Leptolyngbyaceae cyanobacterium RU_5_1]|nr:hypothetical protein [Leptolyngbyaceae cyanobacterium RU_5_1]
MKNAKNTQNLLIKATSILGVAGVSLLLSLPVLAQASRVDTPGTGDTQERLEPNSTNMNQRTNSEVDPSS